MRTYVVRAVLPAPLRRRYLRRGLLHVSRRASLGAALTVARRYSTLGYMTWIEQPGYSAVRAAPVIG
jgi:hypothetical protein